MILNDTDISSTLIATEIITTKIWSYIITEFIYLMNDYTKPISFPLLKTPAYLFPIIVYGLV